MAYYKVYLTLSAIITCHVANADYEYERLKALHRMQYRDITRDPWNSQHDSFEVASSEALPRYYDSYESSEDPYESSSERFPISGIIKKEPSEDKSFKKPTSSFYVPFTKKDPSKLKELALSSETAYCQEIKVKSVGPDGEPRKGNTICYRCKDPKTKSTYHRCFYKSDSEESASSTKVEHFLPAPVNFRYRRSNFDENHRSRNPYRFADEYFTDSTRDVPAAHKKKGEKCERIVKDSMVCMVCKDAKTNGKYEQCSYVKQPLEKSYSYRRTSNSGKPEEQRSEKDPEEDAEEGSYSESSASRVSDRRRDPKPSKEEPYEYSYSNEFRPKKTPTAKKRDEEQDEQDEAPHETQHEAQREAQDEEQDEARDEVQDSPKAGCKQVQKDSRTCTVCKDPKNGGTYEKCTYNYEPSNKLYKYTRSKSIGHPEKTSSSPRDSDKATGASSESRNSDYPRGSESTSEDAYFGRSTPSSYPRGSDKVSEAEGGSDGPAGDGSPYYSGYSYPEESSEASSGGSYEDREKSASERQAENIHGDHCKEVHKDSMTCRVCKDPKTGSDSEKCFYSYRPKDKLYAYTQSKSFGGPREGYESQGEESGDHEEERPAGSETKEPYESYVPESTYEASTKDETRSKDDEDDEKGQEAVDTEYLHTAKKKAEIEGFLQNFRKEDRSKCKKVIRDKMTCYQCVDDEGFQKEECVYVTGQEPDNKEQLAFHEVKEYQLDPSSSHATSTKTKRVTPPPPPPLEPVVAASKNSYVKVEKPDSEYPDEASSQTTEESKEAEPYDYTSETRPVYNRALGMTLPAYMFTISEQEAAFDEAVASSHRDRR